MINSKEEFIKEIEDLETTKEKGDYFLQTLCQEFFPDEDINYLDGSGDGGIDAYFTSSYNWFIIQSKYGSSYRGIDSVCCEFSKILIHLEDEGYTGKNNTFVYLRDFIRDKIEEKTITLYLLTCDKINKSELEAFNTIKTIFSDKYKIKFNVENLYIDLLFSKSSGETKYEIKLPGNFIQDDGSGELVGKVKFDDLYTLMQTFENVSGDIKLFYKSNVRLFLQNKLAKSITETISKEPSKFFQRNNGITILTDGIKHDHDGNLILCNPDCINGCQTSWNIYKYVKDSKVPEASLCITVLDVSKLSKEDKNKITECRNKQTSVKSVIDVFDDKIEIIKNTLRNDFGKVIQIKKGEFTRGIIELIDLVGVGFCIDGFPGVAKQRKENDYKSKEGVGYLEKMSTDKDFLALSYKLSEILLDLKKSSYKYYVGVFKYLQISVLYSLIIKTIITKDYKTILIILNNTELFEYFMKATNTIVKTYIDIKRNPAKFTLDFNTDNLDILSRCIRIDKAEKLNDLISFWYEDVYMGDDNSEIRNKILENIKRDKED